MADADKKEEKKEKKKGALKEKLVAFLPWIIMAVVVIVCAGSGFGAGRLFASLGASKTAEPAQEQPQEPQLPDPFEELKADPSKAGAGSIWYYTLTPVVANLDEPGATRYIRASLILGVSAEMDQIKGALFFDEKIPILVNWLTIYLSNLTIDDVTGAANLRRIQSQILDAFNEELFPNSKPLIKKIFLKEFPIQ